MTASWAHSLALVPKAGYQRYAPFSLHLTFLKYLCSKLRRMSLPRVSRFALPLQVAAVCYRRVNSHAEFLLVNTNGGSKWTFPKGAPEPRLSHSQAAEREAKEEAGAIGIIEPRHFHIYIHSKGVFWQPGGVQEYVVKAFLMEVRQTRRPEEDYRNPDLVRCRKSARYPGQRPRSQIRPRTPDRDRPRAGASRL